MKAKNKYAGLHVHKDTTVVAVADGGREGEVRLYGEISSDLGALEKVLRKLGGEGITLHVVEEAGPTGFVLYRRLRQLGIECIVVRVALARELPGFVWRLVGLFLFRASVTVVEAITRDCLASATRAWL